MKNRLLLILFIFITILSYAQNDLSCEAFHSGFFEYEEKHSDYIIYREGNYQIEYNIKNGEWITIKMSWEDDCHYSFKYVNTNIPDIKQYIGQSMDVEIVSVNANGYEYLADFNNGEQEFDGTIIFLETEIEESMKKKIKRKMNKTKR